MQASLFGEWMPQRGVLVVKKGKLPLLVIKYLPSPVTVTIEAVPQVRDVALQFED